jgi:hypothetical protein
VGEVSTFELRRGSGRARTRTEWLDSRHSFAFGAHYDPDNTHFGVLLAHNEDLLQPGPGYPVHAHRNVEILTWVAAGSLTHRDSAGVDTVTSAGQLQHLSAGSGIRHTEFSSAADQPVRLVQMWLSPDTVDAEPICQHLDATSRLRPGELVALASGQDRPGTLRIRQRQATLSAARLAAGDAIALPVAPLVHLFVVDGSVRLTGDTLGAGDVQQSGDALGAGEVLRTGDALRTAGAGEGQLVAVEPAELLVWDFGVPVG